MGCEEESVRGGGGGCGIVGVVVRVQVLGSEDAVVGGGGFRK